MAAEMHRYYLASDVIVTYICLYLLVGPRGSVVKRQSLASVLSPSCAQPVADG